MESKPITIRCLRPLSKHTKCKTQLRRLTWNNVQQLNSIGIEVEDIHSSKLCDTCRINLAKQCASLKNIAPGGEIVRDDVISIVRYF